MESGKLESFHFHLEKVESGYVCREGEVTVDQLPKELETMGRILELLLELSPDAQLRALSWLTDYCGKADPEDLSGSQGHGVARASQPTVELPEPQVLQQPQVSQQPQGSPSPLDAPAPPAAEIANAAAGANHGPAEASQTMEDEDATYDDDAFESFSELYELVGPRTARQKVAVAAWWIEEEQGKQSWKGSDVASLYEDMGSPLSYISTTIAHEKQREDPFVERIARSDTGVRKQGDFHLTQFGRAFVEAGLYE